MGSLADPLPQAGAANEISSDLSVFSLDPTIIKQRWLHQHRHIPTRNTPQRRYWRRHSHGGPCGCGPGSPRRQVRRMPDHSNPLWLRPADRRGSFLRRSGLCGRTKLMESAASCSRGGDDQYEHHPLMIPEQFSLMPDRAFTPSYTSLHLRMIDAAAARMRMGRFPTVLIEQ